MTVELVEPFVWPNEVTDFAPWDRDFQISQVRDTKKEQAKLNPQRNLTENKERRKSLAQQAKDLLEGRVGWKPTWQSIPEDVKVMQGATSSGMAGQ